MADTKHTPGPWGPRSLPDMVGTENMLIASVYPMHGDAPEECEANALLIAAAPDMLAALQALEECYCEAGTALTRDERHRHRQTLMSARAAIAKATGKPHA